MRILTICANLGRGGTQRVAQNFSVAYRRAGHEVAVLAHDTGGPRQARLERVGISVLASNGDLNAALTAADDFNPDLIHIHRPGMRNDRETAILRRLKRAHRRVVETNVFARVDYSAGADLIDVHFQLSAWCMWRWRQWLGGERRAGVVVPNAVDPEGFVRASPQRIQAFRERHGVPQDAYLCGRVGQPTGANWHPQILYAFAAIAKRDAGARMVALGLPDCLRPTLAGLEPDVRRRIVILPLTDSDQELADLYSSLDCFIHSAISGESFGMVLTEAMLCGCPVVTSSRPWKSNSQVEVVGHLEAGIVAASVAGLADAALLLWREPALRHRLAAAARDRTVTRYGADGVAQLALRVGRLALESGDRADLVRRLEAEQGLQTHTSDEQAKALLRGTLGSPRRTELMAMRFVHNPVAARAVYWYLYWKLYRKFQ